MELFGIILAVVFLGAIAFPKVFAPPESKKKKTVGSTYWGYYEGTPERDHEHGRVAVPKPSRPNHQVAGSVSYARGPAGGKK